MKRCCYCNKPLTVMTGRAEFAGRVTCCRPECFGRLLREVRNTMDNARRAVAGCTGHGSDATRRRA